MKTLTKELIINTLFPLCKQDKSHRPICSNVFQKENVFQVTNGHIMLSVTAKGEAQNFQGICGYSIDNNKQIQVNATSEVGNYLSMLERVSYMGPEQPLTTAPMIEAGYLAFVLRVIEKLSGQSFKGVLLSKGLQDQVVITYNNPDLLIKACIMEIRRDQTTDDEIEEKSKEQSKVQS